MRLTFGFLVGVLVTGFAFVQNKEELEYQIQVRDSVNAINVRNHIQDLKTAEQDTLPWNNIKIGRCKK